MEHVDSTPSTGPATMSAGVSAATTPPTFATIGLFAKPVQPYSRRSSGVDR